jgi:AbrB family looped-hinge helix DNA binding protein
MRSTIDSAGRIVIPRDIRAAAGLEAGMAVEIDIHDGSVSIEPAPSEIRIVRRGKLRVAVATKPTQPLRQKVVDVTRERVRRRR